MRVWRAFRDQFVASLAIDALVQMDVFRVYAAGQVTALPTLPAKGISSSLQLATAVQCRGDVNTRAVFTGGSITRCSQSGKLMCCDNSFGLF